ncbi:FAD-dependent oxidoreductase, partial [Nocardia sp. NPDC059154]
MSEPWQISTDVLVIGGGPAACWAAVHAREAGAEVVLVDKGYCGTSGATAPSGTGVWYVAPEATARANAKAAREALGGHLADHYWMDRVLDQTYANMNRLAVEGRYPFPVDPGTGEPVRTGVQGPEYMRRMRAWVKRLGVLILDHSPALELLVDAEGVVRGAAGYRRQAEQDYRITAGAVVLATGG